MSLQRGKGRPLTYLLDVDVDEWPLGGWSSWFEQKMATNDPCTPCSWLAGWLSGCLAVCLGSLAVWLTAWLLAGWLPGRLAACLPAWIWLGLAGSGWIWLDVAESS